MAFPVKKAILGYNIDPDTGLPISNPDLLRVHPTSSLEAFVLGQIGDNNAIINNITQSNGQPIQTRDNFLNAIGKWEASLTLNSLWMVFFTVPDRVNDSVMKAYGEHIINQDFGTAAGNYQGRGGIGLARKKLLAPDLNRTMGCLFAQTVGLPPEQNAASYHGPTQRGFLKGPVLDHRQQFSSINIEFLETGISFVDFLIRPWTIISGHEGYVARPGGNLGATIMLVNFMRGGVDMKPNAKDPGPMGIENTRGFVPRKIWIFDDCMPINISAERYSYTSEGAVDRRDTEWVFKKYQIILPHLITNMDDWEADEKDKVQKHWSDSRELREGYYYNKGKDKVALDKHHANEYWAGNEVPEYGQASSVPTEDGATTGAGPDASGVGVGGNNPSEEKARAKTPAAQNAAKPWTTKEFGVKSALGIQAEKYWKGERTEHHLAQSEMELGGSLPYRGIYHTTGIKGSRGGIKHPLTYAKPYGVNPVDIGTEGATVVEGQDGSQIGFTPGAEIPEHVQRHGNTYYSPSDREMHYLNRGDIGLTMHDSNLYWQGKSPYEVKPVSTGSTGGLYPSREIAPRGPIPSSNPYPSTRPDRFSILSLFGL